MCWQIYQIEALAMCTCHCNYNISMSNTFHTSTNAQHFPYFNCCPTLSINGQKSTTVYVLPNTFHVLTTAQHFPSLISCPTHSIQNNPSKTLQSKTLQLAKKYPLPNRICPTQNILTTTITSPHHLS